MYILHSLLREIKEEFNKTTKVKNRGLWFIYTIIAIILPFTSSRTSALLRTLETLFGFNINKKRYYRFMASPKIPWQNLWIRLWHLIPEPETNGRLLIALDDSINPKSGKKIYACEHLFDHAAKQNQSKYPWAQNVVLIGLLKIVKGRWSCLPLASSYYNTKKYIQTHKPIFKGKPVEFQTKLQQAVAMILKVGKQFPDIGILIVTDSWFGNNGLWKPLRQKLNELIDLLSRLRANCNIFDLPEPCTEAKRGRPLKYGKKLGTTSSLAAEYRDRAKEYSVNLYGKVRTVLAYERVVMLKTLKCKVKVVWVYRRTQWTALFTTDITLSVEEMIEYYGARWKIEACFKELKQDIGSAETQTRNPVAVTNHLQFCMMATSLTWIYACRLEKTPARRHAVNGRTHYAFSDIRRLVARAAMDENFSILCPPPGNSILKSLASAFMRLAA